MTKYQLAKLMYWAGNLETRKRMQKVVYLLQAGGCPFGADFFLHRFGPYSHEVARLTGELVTDGVLNESESQNAAGHQFGYRLTEHGEKLLAAFEVRSAIAKRWSWEMASFESLAKELVNMDLRELEIASTIAYFYNTMHDWEKAKDHACRFKDIKPDTVLAKGAEALAQKVVG